jgi:peptide deformylase
MILPVYAYGSAVLRDVCEDIEKSYPALDELIENMWETMYNAQGVGLAAPQVGLDIRLFLVDSTQLVDEKKASHSDKGVKMVFINAEILEEKGQRWDYEEGCLSIPEIRENVNRQTTIRIRYQDEEFKQHEKVFDGISARIIQHEYDHIEGVLFTDYLRQLKRRLLKKKLDNISKGKVDVRYKMRFPRPK